jgi:molybdate transport repressor ModE-like protein
VEIRELRAFAVVAEEGSLSAAARRLHLSQSALSQTIQSLERQLGVQLLLRSRTGVTTTEAGTILLREGRALIAQYDQILAAVAGRDGAGPGVLKVGIPLELPADLLPGVLAELSTTFPLTRVEVSHASPNWLSWRWGSSTSPWSVSAPPIPGMTRCSPSKKRWA